MLQECQEVFEQDKDLRSLGSILAGRASVEDKRGHGELAINLQRNALRYSYLTGRVGDVAASHHNLGNYLERHAHQSDAALVQHLAAALVYKLTGSEDLDLSVRQASQDLRAGDDVAVPEDVEDLCARVAQVPGADLAGLLSMLTPDRQAVQQGLQELIIRAQALAVDARG